MRRLLAIFFAVSVIHTSLICHAVEFLVTDSNGVTIGNTSSDWLDLGHNPTPKTIQLWLTFNASEQATANAAGGLMGGGARITPSNASVANIFPPGSSSVINPNSQWKALQILFNSLTNPTAIQTSFSRGQDSGLFLGNDMKILLMEYVISPGATINSTGTQFSVVVPTSALFKYGTSGSQTVFSTQPSNFTFTVVPEPSTYVFCSLATFTLFGLGFRKRISQYSVLRLLGSDSQT